MITLEKRAAEFVDKHEQAVSDKFFTVDGPNANQEWRDIVNELSEKDPELAKATEKELLDRGYLLKEI